jgi:hypothetical protein
MLGRDAEVFHDRVLEGTRDGSVEKDVLGGQNIAECETLVGGDDDVVQVLGSDAVREVGKCTTIVGEEEVQVGKTGKEARVDDTRDRTASVKGEFLNDWSDVNLRSIDGMRGLGDLQGPKLRLGGMIVSAG